MSFGGVMGDAQQELTIRGGGLGSPVFVVGVIPLAIATVAAMTLAYTLSRIFAAWSEGSIGEAEARQGIVDILRRAVEERAAGRITSEDLAELRRAAEQAAPRPHGLAAWVPGVLLSVVAGLITYGAAKLIWGKRS